MTEEPQARRRRVANKIRIKASPLRMPIDDFNRTFRQPQVIPAESMREQIEEHSQQMFCDCCIRHADIGTQAGALEGTVLHVTIEDDPLRNYWKLATLRCYNCGFQEMVALDTPTFNPGEADKLTAGGLLGGRDFATGIVSAPDPYVAEYTKRIEAEQKRQAQAKAQAQMAQMQAKQASAFQQLQDLSGLGRMDDMQQYMNELMRVAGIANSPPVQPVRKTATEVRMQQEHAQSMFERARRALGLG
jgi:hypothetical protein